MTAPIARPRRARTTAVALRMRRSILRWFATHGRAHLPWRRTRDPWKVLVSETMLQQTQVDRVIPKYRAFVSRWPTPRALSRARLSDVLAAWSGLGYNRRAKFLHDAARAIVARHGGTVPRAQAELEALPGVGRYTSRAVASFAHNEDVTLWDVNVRRIFLRVLHGGEFARRIPDDAALERALAQALPRGRSRDWHGALMDFGSAVCTSRAPACASCPLRRFCVAAPHFAAGQEAQRRLVPRQAAFAGSRRQARGALLRMLAGGPVRVVDVRKRLDRDDADSVISSLIGDGLVKRSGSRISLP